MAMIIVLCRGLYVCKQEFFPQITILRELLNDVFPSILCKKSVETIHLALLSSSQSLIIIIVHTHTDRVSYRIFRLGGDKHL